MAIDETKIVQKCKLCGEPYHPGHCRPSTKATHEIIEVQSWGQRAEPALRAFVFEWKILKDDPTELFFCCNCKRNTTRLEKEEAERIYPNLGGVWCPQCARECLREASA